MYDNKEIILNFLNNNLPVVSLIAFILLVLVYGHLFYKLKTKKESPFLKWLSSIALPLGFFSTIFATLMSIIYSDYLGEAPCGLCWLQRIFIFSQAVIFAIAYIKNDTKIFAYTLWLSIIGGIIAIYHEWLQIGYNELIPCPVTPGFIDCATPTFIKYGFVTMPFSSLIVFLFIILLSIIVNKKVK